jgi:hypothetical protein
MKDNGGPARSAPKPAYDLSDAEKRDLTQLIQHGQPLPEKYRFILFEDKREVELVWNGKTREVCNTVLPFQSLEHIDEPRKETKVQEDLFDSRGRQRRGWTNKLIWGDNKLILSSLKSGALREQIEEAGGLKLIYIDPPFDVGADFSMDIEIGGETFHKEPNLLEQSFVEATPRYDRKDKLHLRIELTDFSVYYTQGAADAAIAALKEGKSDVICDNGQLVKITKDRHGAVTREVLTREWTDWIDYWAVDFDYMSRKEIIKVPRGMGVEGHLPGMPPAQAELTDYEERWTGGYIFENEWQSFRTRQNRKLELVTAEHAYQRPGRYTVAVKVIDIFGNDTMTLVPVSVG